jgi:protein-disulfide isomerase
VGKQASERSRALRQARQAIEVQRGRRRRMVLTAGGAVVVALIVAIAVSVVNAAGRDSTVGAPAGAVVTPAGATAAGALTVGDPGAAVRLEVFLDYMCPFCGRFEGANGKETSRLVQEGSVRLEIHPLSFLDRASAGGEYSTRAANAVATVADRAPDRLLAFHQRLFDRQPAEGTRGLSDAEIAALAREVGVPDTVVGAFTRRLFVPWIVASTEKAFQGGISGTPTVRINGATFAGDLYTAGQLTRAVTAAAARPQ